MYVSPKHPDYQRLTAPREAAPPPEPPGRLLATFPRPGRGRGPDSELRVVLDEFRGHAYVSVRLWTRSAEGSWFLTKTGCSIRLSECEDFAAVLEKATRLANAPPAKLNRMCTERTRLQ